MGIRSMQGTASHLEYIGPRGRKYRKNCIFYKDKLCRNKKAQTYLVKCIGRLYCKYYEDDSSLKDRINEENKALLKYKDNENKGVKFKNQKKVVSRRKKKRITTKIINNQELYDKAIKELLYKNIKLKCITFNQDIEIQIVNKGSASEINRKYSIDSNFGLALIGKKVGDVIKIRVGSNCLEYKILYIK